MKRKEKKLSKKFGLGDYQKILNFYNTMHKFRTLAKKTIFSSKVFNNYFFNSLPAHFYKVESIKEFCCEQKFDYTVVEDAKEVEVLKPQYLYSEDGVVCFEEAKKMKYLSPEIYIAKMCKVGLVGENSVLLSEKKLLNDMVKKDVDNRYDLAFGSIKNINKENAIIQYANSDVIIPNGISLIGFAPWNYFHLTVEILSRLEYVDEFTESSKFPLLIDEIILKIPQYKDLLNIMNKKNLKIIPLKKSVFYKIEELVYPSNSSFMPINVKDFSSYASDYIVSSSALNFVRTRVLGHYGIETKQAVGTKKIIISRKNLKHARLKNERRVLELMSNRGFEIIFPECMSLQEQVRVFSQAGVVAGTTGAAFTNLIYCPKNALIMNIIPKRYNFFLFSSMANALGLKCCFIDAEVKKKSTSPSLEIFDVDLKLIDAFLNIL